MLRIEETFPPATLPPRERLLQLARKRVRLLGSNPGLAWILRSEQAQLTLPADAVEDLRAVAERSKRFLLAALEEGAREGDIRRDIAPEVLLVPVLGTIHALIGMPGIHRAKSGPRRPDADRVLAALQRMLAPGDAAEEEPE